MSKKFFSAIFVLVGVLMFAGAGCGSKSLVDGEQTNNDPSVVNQDQGIPDTIATESPDKFYNSVEEIATPAGLPSELKSILNEACGEVKLTDIAGGFSDSGNNLLFYTWKNKPTAGKLISLFEENGYKVETVLGETLLAKKGNLSVGVQWIASNLEAEQQILVELTRE
ncbi:hypothetical protein A2316_02590 [Candidatus Falkowbacteria bacterium RIFOXYB2_FULL_38_15]|uniref:LytR/CpsA/Psr regulator C-terminal domain-containing protein n=1 Tax=Candidatus Falkowbacteria bacterium RIFOXYA2_FULL_38_12 TaxID=1797993 RepID=A0A1F5S383_9BACT|nr:MAG: hypothetical protein A2257_03080 [Candidatus Falkowbacteria bacterium RIFOXYA2_FULL_38_12]OGF32538.1 MAG: hypothetical protein A2316_02590 [Candidatus Falkowbacteria bacterium RIFOXYB2_FULL_38_15]OGF41996.1 MAG: hypothetical protein A2555_04040 [Candidatus Falkowbacteria bacterium RIFOXYD2_FULL_39_16]